jgi:thioredoxin-dependent peroxiredoxin
MITLFLVLAALILSGIITIFFWSNRKAQLTSTQLIGKQAPDFALMDETTTSRSLREFRGQKVVLYFYPKDDTPGCTKQACNFRDLTEQYEKSNIKVIGINFDSPSSHAAFKAKYHLPFILLSDPTKEIAKLYGAHYGFGPELFPRRVTFLINEDGIIVNVLENITLDRYGEEVLQAFR